ncbi:large conductance mechanosensitive channel protein MscL [Apilactobacillus apinorum]|uniref:large conductance mechanosensitive channel protein MscL n=1 Tax=Apilactobacillus apinorum TaxID=1218495 RepID=UPI0006B4BDCA|nr:large conductance mechanosensitive channel protein MscL [Apilactobacillus apinorum]KOY68735.1 Large-conductance mechanosensitive channel [Apilactobacillus apinorum]CAI2656712.1 mscL Large-conductance mechanosensitive channel [Apilactobacillus apinorum]
MLKEFKDFIAKGNVMDLAVGVIIGSAFTSIVKSFTADFINPILGIFTGQIGLSSFVITVGKAKFLVGSFINDLINFLIIAFVVFLIVRTYNRLAKRDTTPKDTKTDTLLGEIRDLLKDQQNNK